MHSGTHAPSGARQNVRRRLLRRYARLRRPEDLEHLVRSYRPLVRALARRFGSPDAREDLEQAASEGLIKAIQRFEPERGVEFATFAVPTILGELRRHRRDTAWPAHVPRRVQERVQAVRAATDRMTSASGKPPTARQLAYWLRCDEEEIVEALCAASSVTVVSLDGPARPENDALAVVDRLGTTDPGYEQVECLAAIEDALPLLSPAQRRVIRMRFGDDLTQSQIAGRLGVSRSEVARVLGAAVERLRSGTLPRTAA
jgi:RNA polymerase sigma-B factor